MSKTTKTKCFAVSLLMIAASGCATTAPDPVAELTPKPRVVSENFLSSAETALKQEQYRDAGQKFRQVVQHQPENVRAKLGLAESLLGMGAAEEALAEFASLEESPEAGLQARQGKGIALALTGQTDAARGVLRDVVNQDPSLWRAWNALGHCHDLNGDWTQAETAYRRGLEAQPRSAQIHNNLGMSLMRQKDYEQATTHFIKAIEAEPGLEIARTNLRLALAFQGRYGEAMTGVSQEEMPEVLNNLGYVAFLRGDKERAKAYFLRTLEASPRFYKAAWANLRMLETSQPEAETLASLTAAE